MNAGGQVRLTLPLGVAQCGGGFFSADYLDNDAASGINNATLAVTADAPNDRRIPWPAPVDLTEYRTAAQYNNTPVGELSGRVANIVNDANGPTGTSSATFNDISHCIAANLSVMPC